MNNRLLTLLFLLTPLALQAQTSRTIHLTTAGTLSDSIAATEQTTLTQLTVSGPVNSDDIRLLRSMAGRNDEGKASEGSLTELDLTDAQITEGGSYYLLWYNNEFTTVQDVVSNYMFNGCTFTSIKLPSTITLIEGGAFSDCYNLTGTLQVPEGVTRVGEYAFSSCVGLEHIELPSTLREGTGTGYYKVAIGANAFNGCHALQDITVPEGVEKIGSATLKNCYALTTVDLPSSLTRLDTWALQGCSALTTVSVRATTPPTVGYQAFDESHYTTVTLHVPAGTLAEYQGHEEWGLFQNIVEDLPNAIVLPAATATTASPASYNLQGQRVGQDYRGIVIENGRKHFRR